MIDRDSPVTEDELHVYVDGELPGDRLAAVERSEERRVGKECRL